MAVGMRPNPSTALDNTPEAAVLFERYAERIHAYCVHVLRDRAEAEDAVQTTFLNAHRALQRGVVPEHEYAWLHTIAKNACRTLQRTRGRRAPIADDVDVDSIPGHEEDGSAEELRGLLAEALTGLPETQRRAVVLREWHGLTPVEIASRLGLSVPATYALLTRARRSLAHALSTTVRGPLSALNLGSLGELLRAFAKTVFGGGAPKVAVAVAVATVSVGVGGAVVDRSLDDAPGESARPTAGVSMRTFAASSRPPSTAAQDARPTSRGQPRRAHGAHARTAALPSTPPSPVGPAGTASETPSTPTATEPAQSPTAAPTSAASSVQSPASGIPLPPLPGLPPLLPDLTSEEPLLTVDVPPLPAVPEVGVEAEVGSEPSVDVQVQPPQLPLP